ncbi:YmaF family protein [Desulfoscipio gibsoniae]|uniref:YmaF family protein n=1 Tax=Desulfoscipio gibsoniae TaxID=102134 RepID=UPI00338E8D9E
MFTFLIDYLNLQHENLSIYVTISLYPAGQRTHVHQYYNKTSFDDGHTHSYKVFTSLEIPTKPGFHVHRY